MINTIEKLKSINNHILAKMVFSDAITFDADLYDLDQVFEVEPKPKMEFSELEFYSIRCGYTLSNLLGLLEQIVKIPSFIIKYRSNDITKKYGITRLDDITYNFENYIIKYKSLEDRVLLFVNAIFHIGIDSNAVNYKLIIDNAHIKSNNIRVAIIDLHKQIDIFGSQRNKIIHQHSIADSNLRKIEGMLIVSRSDDEIRKYARNQYRTLIKEFAEKMVPELEQKNIDVIGIIVRIFDCCTDEYKKQIKMLKNN